MSNAKYLTYNARIWTGAEKEANWMIFDPASCTILELGFDNKPPVSQYRESRRYDYGGRRIVPGFHESHIHITEYGEVLNSLDLTGCSSIEELQTRVKDYINGPDMENAVWVVGYNWTEVLLGREPTREDLDSICSDQPIVLHRVCIHAAVLNSIALDLLEIESSMESPEGGRIDKFPTGHAQCGEPTGILRENAVDLVRERLKRTSLEKRVCIRAGLAQCLKNGVTAVHAVERDTWSEFYDIASRSTSDLAIRVFYSAYITEKDSGSFPSPGAGFGDMLSCDRVKIFVDGSLGAFTASLSKPYTNSTDNKGVIIYSLEVLKQRVKEFTALGYRLEIHVIGDAALDAALDALEAAQVAPEKRPILTHCQITRSDQFERMRALGVVANIQPQFLTTDSGYFDRIPSELLQDSYAWKSMLNHGIRCAASSDAPVEPATPFIGMYDAIFRQRGERTGQRENQFRPEESLTVQQAMELYTKGGAYVAMQEHKLGQLLPGYQADFVVIGGPRDVFDHPEDLLCARVDEVWVKGVRRL